MARAATGKLIAGIRFPFRACGGLKINIAATPDLGLITPMQQGLNLLPLLCLLLMTP